MQRFASSQSYTSFEDQRRPAITSDMSPFHHSPSPTSAPFASMLPPPPPTPDAVSALGTPGAPHPPIALSSHSSSSHLHHQAGFDTFDDIQWSWNSPSIDSARHQLSSSATQHDPLSSHAAGANVHYGYSFSSPASQSNSFGPGSPHSPHLYNPANSDATSGPGGANAGGFGPLSAPGSNVGSYSTSPPIISPLASMPPHNPDGEAVYQARSGSSGSSHATSLLSSSLTMNTIDYQPNPAQARPTLAAHFTFPSTAPSTTPSQAISHQLGRSTSSHTPNHARSSHQTHHHHSFSMPQSLTPAQLNTDWSTSPPLSGFMGHSPGTPSLHAVPDSPHSPSMISLSGTTMASPGTGTGNGARPIRRRPVRKSESDSSYSSPISAAARIQMARTLSGNGGSMNMSSAPASHEMTISTSGGPGSYAMYMPSPSSPLAASPPVIPGYLPATQYHHQHVQNSTHKHSRSRSSGGSSSPGTMGMLLSTSPTSPADITLAMAASRPGAGYLRGMSTNAGILGDESKPLVDEAMNMSDVEDDLSPIADGAGIDGDGADEGGMKKRRRRSLKEEKDSTSPKPKEEGPRKSLLQPPKAAPSTWQIYFTDQLQLYRSRHPDQKLNVAQAAKELAQEYKQLTSEQREPYKRRAQALKAERDRQMAAWARTLTPDDVRQENAFRAAQRKDGKSRKANMKDPNAPKKPLSAYFMFLQRIRASPEMVREVFGDEQGTTKQSVLAAAKWRSMSDEEKKPFLARAEQEKLIYEEKRRHYEESFADPDDADAAGFPRYQHITTLTSSSNGLTLSGHFVGIEQLSLDDTFVSPSGGQLSNIRAFQVGGDQTQQPSTKVEVTEEDMREAMESTMLERIMK